MFGKKILDKLIGTKPSDSAEAKHPYRSELKTTLTPLDKVETGLAAKVLAYVTTGDGRPVLATLSAKQAACNTAFSTEHKLTAQLTNLIRKPGAPLPATARLIEVCANALHTNHFGYWGRNVKTPALLVLLHAATRIHHTQTRQNDEMLHLKNVMALTPLLDHEISDLSALIFGTRYAHYAQNLLRDPKSDFPLLFKDVEALRDSLAKLEAWGREDVLKFWDHSGFKPDEHLVLLFELAGDGSVKVREAARKMLAKEPADLVTPLAIEHLGAGKAATRTAMVQILGDSGTDAAQAALQAQLDKEKTQSVRMLIEQFLSLDETQNDSAEDGIIAVDGSLLVPAPFQALADHNDALFGPADIEELKAAEEKHYQARLAFQKEHQAKGYKPRKISRLNNAKYLVDAFNGSSIPQDFNKRHLDTQIYGPWITKALGQMPPARALRISLGLSRGLEHAIGDYAPTQWITEALAKDVIDIRHILKMAKDTGTTISSGYNQREAHGATMAEKYLNNQFDANSWGRSYQNIPPTALIPTLLEHLQMLADALPPKTVNAVPNTVALRMLEMLPALPKSFVQPVLFAAIGEAKAPREIARKLLQNVDGIDDVLIEVLSDRRQAIRSNGAEFLAQRGTAAALPALAKRLKTEKSDFTRAAMIAAIADLGGKTDPYLGKKPLSDEADKHISKLKADKIDWLKVDQAPALSWKDGKPCPANLADGWLRLAVKLKAPNETALWSLYLDQLTPETARGFSDWILTSWIAYDSYQTPRDEQYQQALENARHTKAHYANSTHNYYKDKTVEEIAAQTMAYMQANYPHSGSDSKGILALAIRATPTAMAQQCSAYLKQHGKRVAQAKSILDALAGADTPESLQVIVATATRFKQRTVREHAENLVALVAEKRGWSADELADRSIPSGGLEDGGQLDLPVGEDAKPYAARLDSDLKLRVFNPDGREIKSLPAGKDENTKESKALLSSAKKTVKTVTTQQAARLHEAIMSERSWNAADWQKDLAIHPIMTRLTERVVWRGLDPDGKMVLTFRPTAEGDLLDADGEDITLDKISRIDVAHGSHFDAETLTAWNQHLTDFEVAPLFVQLGRPVLKLTPEQKNQDKLEDRKGYVMEALRLKSLAEKYGYQSGPNEDGGWFYSFNKAFVGAGITAQIDFTGTGPYADAHDCAITGLSFHRSGKSASWSRGRMNLKDVPALLLSECWNDVHEIAAKGAFDADWEKKSYY